MQSGSEASINKLSAPLPLRPTPKTIAWQPLIAPSKANNGSERQLLTTANLASQHRVSGTLAQNIAVSSQSVDKTQNESPNFNDEPCPQSQVDLDIALKKAVAACKRLAADGLPEDALLLGRAFLQLDPSAVELQLLLGDVYWRQEKWVEGARHHNNAYKLLNNELETKHLYRFLECLISYPHEAIKALSICQSAGLMVNLEDADLSRDPQLRVRMRLVAAVLRLNGRVEEAEEYVLKIFEQIDVPTELEMKEWGKIAFEQGRYDEVLEFLGTSVLCNESACALYRLGRYESLACSFLGTGLRTHCHESATWVAASLLELPPRNRGPGLDNAEIFARLGLAKGNSSVEAMDILRRVLEKQGVKNADWKERFLEFLNNDYSDLLKRFRSEDASWIVAEALRSSGVHDAVVYRALDEVKSHECAIEAQKYAKTGVIAGLSWRDALNRKGADHHPDAFRAWMSRFFTGFWAGKDTFPLSDVIPLYLEKMSSRVRLRAEGQVFSEYSSPQEKEQLRERRCLAGLLILNAFEAKPVDSNTFFEVIQNSCWQWVDSPVRGTQRSTSELRDAALDDLLERRRWGHIKENRIKALPLRASFNTDYQNLATSKHWQYVEELAQLSGNYSGLFGEVENFKGTEAALVWLESNKAKMASQEYKRLSSYCKSTIEDRKKYEKNKIKWDKASKKREAVERARGPIAPQWMQDKSREMSEQMLKNELSWRAFNS